MTTKTATHPLRRRRELGVSSARRLGWLVKGARGLARKAGSILVVVASRDPGPWLPAEAYHRGFAERCRELGPDRSNHPPDSHQATIVEPGTNRSRR